MSISKNIGRLWGLIIPTIKCDFCGKKKEAPGLDESDFAEHLDAKGWSVHENDDRVKCPECKKKRK